MEGFEAFELGDAVISPLGIGVGGVGEKHSGHGAALTAATGGQVFAGLGIHGGNGGIDMLVAVAEGYIYGGGEGEEEGGEGREEED